MPKSSLSPVKHLLPPNQHRYLPSSGAPVFQSLESKRSCSSLGLYPRLSFLPKPKPPPSGSLNFPEQGALPSYRNRASVVIPRKPRPCPSPPGAVQGELHLPRARRSAVGWATRTQRAPRGSSPGPARSARPQNGQGRRRGRGTGGSPRPDPPPAIAQRLRRGSQPGRQLEPLPKAGPRGAERPSPAVLSPARRPCPAGVGVTRRGKRGGTDPNPALRSAPPPPPAPWRPPSRPPSRLPIGRERGQAPAPPPSIGSPRLPINAASPSGAVRAGARACGQRALLGGRRGQPEPRARPRPPARARPEGLRPPRTPPGLTPGAAAARPARPQRQPGVRV